MSAPVTIQAVSDLHGHLPGIPTCELLVIAGDICPWDDHSLKRQSRWLAGPFRRWLDSVPADEVVAVAGNHDFLMQDSVLVDALDLPWTYLRDSAADLCGLKLWGTPWTLRDQGGWAFEIEDYPGGELVYDLCPEGVDVLISHQPPYGAGDFIPATGRHRDRRVGSKSLASVVESAAPQLLVCGHIHEDPGAFQLGQTTVANVAMLDTNYKPGRTPTALAVTPRG